MMVLGLLGAVYHDVTTTGVELRIRRPGESLSTSLSSLSKLPLSPRDKGSTLPKDSAATGDASSMSSTLGARGRSKFQTRW